MREMQTQVVIAGGGPAGVMSGVLLARQGIDVVVLERHKDFFRDFRGDTIHPSTLELLYELGWDKEFLDLPHTKVTHFTTTTQKGKLTVADARKLPVRHKFIAFVPQWDFLTFLTKKGKKYPGFTIMMNTEVQDVISDNGRVVGLRASSQGKPLEVKAELVIGADGRSSIVRDKAKLKIASNSSAIDVLWFRLSRKKDEGAPFFKTGRNSLIICINRDTYWQVAMVIPDGKFTSLKEKGITNFREIVVDLIPEFEKKIYEVKDWDDVKLLNVKVDRLRTWYKSGLICIGDAAHAMSPAGGVGINLAIQDAVCAANILGPKIRTGTLTEKDLAKVQKRRELPTMITQKFQSILLKNLYNKNPGHVDPPLFKIIQLFPPLKYLTAYFVGIGFRPEHIKKKHV